MKKFFTLFFAVLVTAVGLTQAPQKMSYQAVVRDGGGALVQSHAVGIRIQILQASEIGSAVYVETHSTSTNANGLVTLEIGSGSIILGTFTGIDWSSGPYFLKTEIDVTGGTSYSITGVSQILSVPYALYAKTAETSVGAVNYYDATQSVIGNNSSVINTGIRNLFIGKSSGMSTTTGSYNTFIGSEAGLNNNVGTNNIAIGLNALRENDEGSGNIAIGTNALEKSKIGGGGAGSLTVAIGMNALRNSITNMNLAIGAEVLQSLTDGGANTGVGTHVMRALINGNGNTAMGYMAMIDATGSASSNVSLGVRSGTKTTGLGNVFIGHESGLINVGYQNVFIGYLAGFGTTWENVSNRLIIHNGYNNITDVPLIYGEFDNSKVVINGLLTATNGIDASNKTITNVSNPVNATDAATKAYVDELKSQIEELQIQNGIEDIDANKYEIVKIGTQMWMKENLKTSKYNDGTEIPNVTNSTAWSTLTTGAYCDYDYNSAYSTQYGRLYNWFAVDNNAATKVASNGGKNVCPTGWHIPSDEEWTTLTTFLGGEAVAGDKLKETGITHWLSSSIGVTNETGFTALPGGKCKDNGISENIGFFGYWWSSTETAAATAFYRLMYYDNSNVDRFSTNKRSGFSVRCVKD